MALDDELNQVEEQTSLENSGEVPSDSTTELAAKDAEAAAPQETAAREEVSAPPSDSVVDDDADDLADEVPEQEIEYNKDSIYCANCLNCKLVPSKVDGGKQYILRIRCNAGKWTKKLGTEKFYKYCTILRRVMPECTEYDPMGDDPMEFIKDLKHNLPPKEESYPVTPGMIFSGVSDAKEAAA